MRTLTIALCLLVTPALADVTGPARVIDGDTLEIRPNGRSSRSHKSPWWNRSRRQEHRRSYRTSRSEWASRRTAAQLRAGLISVVLAFVGLASAGTTARAQDSLLEPASQVDLPIALGTDEEATLFDDRLRLSISQTNRDELLRAIVDAPGALSTGFAESEDFWHREGGLELNALASGPVTLKLSGHYFDERAADSSDLGGLNIGEVTEWRESSHQNLGLDLGLFGDRLSISTGLAWSQTASSLEGDSEDGAFSFGGDNAAWSRVEAKILDGGPISLSAYGHYSLTDPSYQQLGSSSGLVSLEAGEKMEFGGTIAFGSHSVTLSQDTTVSFDDEGAWTTRRRAHNARLDLDLDEYRYADGDLWRFVPSSVSLSGAFAHIEGAGTSGSDDQERGFGLGLAWNWGNADTTADLWYTITNSRALGQKSADSKDWTLDLTQDFYGDWWDVSLYLSLYQYSYKEVGTASLDTSLSGGSSVSFRPEGLPDLVLSFDYDGNDSSMSNYTSSDHYAGFNAALDFSKFLPRVNRESKPYLKLTYYGEVSMFRDSDSGVSTDLGQAVSLTAGFKF